MKKRLHDKKAGIAILAALIVISLTDVILRGLFSQGSMSFLPYMGEPFINIVFSALLIIFAIKGKDRLFYLLCGTFLAYFVLNQLFGLPKTVSTLVMVIKDIEFWGVRTLIVNIWNIVGVLCIIAIGGLLVEYMHDGTIYDKAFNILCVVTVVLILAYAVFGAYGMISGIVSQNLVPVVVVEVLNHLQRITMLFLFTFFAYDSAKGQLKKTDLSK
jgi:hypothetical protein